MISWHLVSGSLRFSVLLEVQSDHCHVHTADWLSHWDCASVQREGEWDSHSVCLASPNGSGCYCVQSSIGLLLQVGSRIQH